MKIKEEDYIELKRLMGEVAPLGLKKWCKDFRLQVERGNISVIKCEATNCLSRLAKGAALMFICDNLYKYMDDSHLKTVYRKIYKEEIEQ